MILFRKLSIMRHAGTYCRRTVALGTRNYTGHFKFITVIVLGIG
jgi:hypothetical protein